MRKRDELKLTIVQPNILWEDIFSNLAHYDSLLGDVKDTDLIVLPELFGTGFTMNVSSLAEEKNGKIITWMKKIAGKKQCFVLGSAIIKENNQYFNRALVVNPQNDLFFYDKRHLFTMGEEDKFYTPGSEKLVFTIDRWRISPFICYDLRFPVWTRNRDKYDVLIYIANWPAVRQKAWNSLLVSRAIENQCYTVGVNRIGVDGKNVKYKGDSQVIDPKGDNIYLAPSKQEIVETIALNYSGLQMFRRKFPVLDDGDKFEIEQ